MANKTYLDKNGLTYFWGKVKAKIPTKTSDLTNDSNYVKNTDYASNNTAGVIKTGNSLSISNSGGVYAATLNYNDYQSVGNERFIGKGTLENVLTGKGYSTFSGNYNDLSNKPTIPKVESGLITSNNMTNATIAGDAGKKYSITFTNTYTTPPNVVICYYNNKPHIYGNINVSVANITTTGCDVYFYYNVSTADLGISYSVIGE